MKVLDLTPDRHSSIPAQRLSIAGWTVDASTLRISNGPETIRLEPRAMAVLMYLAARPGETVSRDELEREVWHGQLVVYEALSNTITKLRKAFGDDPHEPRVIETVSKLGYRLIAEVVTSPGEPADAVSEATLSRQPPRPTRWLWSTGAIVVVGAIIGVVALWPSFRLARDESPDFDQAAGAPEIRLVIAVLPFTNLSTDPHLQQVADGLTSDLIAEISNLSGLLVIVPNSTFAYEGFTPRASQLSGQYRVQYVVKGSVRRAGDELRINTQLVDVASGAQLWAERFGGSMDDVFTLQDKVTRNVTAALSIRLSTND